MPFLKCFKEHLTTTTTTKANSLIFLSFPLEAVRQLVLFCLFVFQILIFLGEAEVGVEHFIALAAVLTAEMKGGKVRR